LNNFEFTLQPIRPLARNDRSSPDVRLVTPEQNFAANGVAREINSIYEDTAQNNVVWQPDVYAEARSLAARNNIRRIIDVGCGNGQKLVHFFPNEMYETIGLDFDGSLKLACKEFPQARWIECNLSSHPDLSRVFLDLESTDPTLIIFSDVIEHLPDPRAVLAHVRNMLTRHDSNRLILSTPDRDMLSYKTYDEPPENMAHVREWTIDELTRLCESAGFRIVRRGYTRANQYDHKYSTIFLELRCDLPGYLAFLKSEGMLFADVLPEHLIVTSEYAGLHGTGAIGTFVAEQRMAYGHGNTLCLFTNPRANTDIETIRRLQLVIPEYLLDHRVMDLPLEEIILQAVQQILFYFPDIKKIEYSDYLGSCFRLAQANCAGLFPSALQLIVYCHGITHYFENASQTWFGKSDSWVAEREKISVENADRAVFPTTFLRDLYLECGIDVADDKIVNLRYPYHLDPTRITHTLLLDTIVFYGERSVIKGYDIFLQALDFADDRLNDCGIKRIIFICPVIADTAEDRSRIDGLRTKFDVVEYASLDREDAIDKLREQAHNALCVMPYPGGNHPYALLDVTFAGMLPLMLRTGGMTELFPSAFEDVLLADTTEASLFEKITTLARLSVEERHRLRVNYLEAMLAQQISINDDFRKFGENATYADAVATNGQATVIVPVYNTHTQYIRDLIFGLNNQTVRPAEVIFVDDASDPGYLRILKELLQNDLRLPYRVIQHHENKGLAGARNSGLAATTTEFVINLDSDDVPMNEYVQDIVYRLNCQPLCDAAVPYIKPFDEGIDFNKRFVGEVYRPIGDGVLASQLDNILGHANSGYRVSTLKSLGGWDQSDKSMWEDWALLNKLTSSGHRIGMIPKVGCLYRVRKDSMLRTYKKWPAMRRLARNLVALPRFDAFRLQSLLRHSKQESESFQADLNRLRNENQALLSKAEFLAADNSNLRTQLEHLRADNEQLHTDNSRLANQARNLSAELNRASLRVIRRLVDQLARFPRLYGMARFASSIAWRTAQWVRRIFAGRRS